MRYYKVDRYIESVDEKDFFILKLDDLFEPDKVIELLKVNSTQKSSFKMDVTVDKEIECLEDIDHCILTDYGMVGIENIISYSRENKFYFNFANFLNDELYDYFKNYKYSPYLPSVFEHIKESKSLQDLIDYYLIKEIIE